MGQLSHSISSSRVAAVARALQWASLISARLLSVEMSVLPLLGVLPLGGWMLTGLGSSIIHGDLLPSHPWWSSRKDTTSETSSSICSGSPGETLVASGVCKPHNIGTWTPPYWSEVLPARWQGHLPWGPALEGHVSSLSRSYVPPLSTLSLRHAGTFHAGWQGNGGCPLPI